MCLLNKKLTQRLPTPSNAMINDGSTDTMNIVEYTNHLTKQNGFTEAKEIIRKQGFIVKTPFQFKNTPIEQNIICIKYVDCNQLWNPCWARQCRGIILFFNGETVIPIKYQMQRGAEVITDVHFKQNVTETQDIEGLLPSQLTKLDLTQQTTIRTLLNNEPINGVVSFKVDGSLLAVTIYRKHAELIDSWVELSGDDFATSVLELFKKHGVTGTISTQTTFSVGNDMQRFIKTATNDGIAELVKNACAEYKNIIDGDSGNIQTNKLISVTLNFEAVCANRFDGNAVHTELVMSYEKSFIKLLGYGICYDNGVEFIPHFQREVLCSGNAKIFDEPTFWKITHSSQLNSMIVDLSLAIRNKMKKEEYLQKHVAENDANGVMEFDFEGFIFYSQSANGKYDYNKIKTPEYYHTHKFKAKNVNYLLELSKTASHIFPLTKIVATLYVGLNEKMMRIVNKIKKEFDDSKWITTLPEKAQKGFEQRGCEVKVKMILNTSDEFMRMVRTVFEGEFHELEHTIAEPNEVVATLKSLLMELMKNEDWGDLTKMKQFGSLFGFCLMSNEQ